MVEITKLYTAKDHNEGAEMQVLSDDLMPLDLWIRFVGPDSDVWQQANLRTRQRTLSRLIVEDDERLIDYVLEDLVEAAIDWRGFEQAGAPLEFTKDNFRQLLTQAPYIKDQAILFMNERTNFSTG